MLLAVDGLRITDQASLDKVLDRCLAGDQIPIHVFRRDELRAFVLTLAMPEMTEYVLEPGGNGPGHGSRTRWHPASIHTSHDFTASGNTASASAPCSAETFH